MRRNRGQLSIIIACAVVSGLGALSSPSRADDRKIVYVGIGGPTQDALRKSLFEPFKTETGIEVVEDTGLGAERVQAEVQSGHPAIDFMTIGASAYGTLSVSETEFTFMRSRPGSVKAYLIAEPSAAPGRPGCRVSSRPIVTSTFTFN